MKAFRKHASWYLTGYPAGSELRQRAALVGTLADLDAVIGRLDPDAEIRENALRAARGHTNGPRAVHLPEGWLDLVDDPTPPGGGRRPRVGRLTARLRACHRALPGCAGGGKM